MATIVLMPFHWAASMNATFALARRLRQHGHRVVYLDIPPGTLPGRFLQIKCS
jgi:hypothetical protein